MSSETGTTPRSSPLARRPELPTAAIAALATLALLALGALMAPASLSKTAFFSILPFAAILGIVATGQHLVIQQRGLDLSVAGVISLAAVLVTLLPGANAGLPRVEAFVAIALCAGVLVGIVNGVFVTLLRVPPLVSTIGMNAVVTGCALLASRGIPSKAPGLLSDFALARVAGVPNTIWAMLVTVGLATWVVGQTAVGRRFTAVAANSPSAHSLGVNVTAYRIGTYAIAGLLYAVAGVLLAGFLSTPGLFLGNSYILGSVAAVVVGGNSIAGGGLGSLVATVIGAFFLTYLDQLVLTLGFDRSAQMMTQAAIIICGVGLPSLLGRRAA